MFFLTIPLKHPCFMFFTSSSYLFWIPFFLFFTQLATHIDGSFQGYEPAEEQPLGVDLDFASKGEAVQAQGAADVREDRLDNPHPSTIDESPFDGVDLADHLLGKALFKAFGSASVFR